MNTRKTILAASFFALPAAFFAGGVQADSAQMQQLVPEPVRARKTERTYVFSRSQLKYGLEETGYLNRWVDRPLFVNPKLRGDDAKPQVIYYPSFQRVQQVVKEYGLDGFAFFPETSGRSITYDYTRRSGQEGFQLLTEFIGRDGKPSKSEVLKMALENPASLRINGKMVVTSYSADSKPLAYWQNALAELKKEFGDQFIFLPALNKFGSSDKSLFDWNDKFDANTITAQDVEDIKASLRVWARGTDGLYFATPASIRTDARRFDPIFYRDFVIRLMKSVLAEPEFSEKYFGLAANVGHENSTRVGYTQSSDATKTLRHSFEAALSAEPEIINIPEWDEQNENTSLRPTVYNGTSSMRIMRYYMSKLRGQAPTPLAGDDTTVPNLILSYRKLMVVGETLEIELLNVPDSAGSTPYTARVILEDLNGKAVYTSPVLNFGNKEMQDNTLTIPSETLAAFPVLQPKLEIESAGRKRTFADGLHYIELRPTWNWDYKWVKQPLRDLMTPQKADFQVAAADGEGLRRISTSFAASEPLAYVEVLDNDDVVYSYSTSNEWRENANQVVLSMTWQSPHVSSKLLTVPGSITLENATGRWLNLGSRFPATLKDQKMEGIKSYGWPQRVLLAIDRSQINNAALNVALPGVFEGTIPIRQILDEAVYGISGPEGFNLVVSRYLRQKNMPLHIGANSAQFDVTVMPDLPGSVLHLQAVSVAGRVYRSKPVLASAPAIAKERVAVYSEEANRPVEVEVPANRVPDIRYHFDPKHGSALVTDAGRPFWGILGGYVTQVTERGGGESGDGTPFIRETDHPAEATKTAPDWVKTENGEYALQFDGKGTFVAFPQGVIPRRAGFTITMDIKPDNANGKQIIISNRAYYPGSLTTYIENGILRADFLSQSGRSTDSANSGLPLPAGKWSRLTIRYDQQNLIFSVDGKPGKTLPIAGPGVYDTVSVLGGFGKDWFAGQIQNLRIRHDVD